MRARQLDNLGDCDCVRDWLLLPYLSLFHPPNQLHIDTQPRDRSFRFVSARKAETTRFSLQKRT